MMPTILLITAESILEADFQSFLQQCHARLNERGGEIRQSSDVFIDVSVPHHLEREFELEDVENLTRELGKRPTSYVTIDIWKNAGSRQLATDFIRSFIKRWPETLIEDADDDKLIPIEQFQRNGIGH